MGATTENLNIKINGENKNAKDALSQTENAIGKVGKAASNQKTILDNFKNNWLAITAALGGTIMFTKQALAAFATQEKAEFMLSAAMKQAGTYTKSAYDENVKYAKSLQQMTVYGDEAIEGVQRMLTNFGVSGQSMKDLTKATLDLASAKGMDLKAAADLVAKSVGSSTNALTRYGIEVKGAAGSTERMRTAVDNISRIFGGSATAEANTFAGSVAQLKNAWGDVMETIGAVIADLLRPLIGILKSLSVAMEAMPSSIKLFAVAFMAAMAGAIVITKLFGITMTAATGGISLLIGAIVAGAALMIKNWDSVRYYFDVAWSAIKVGLLAAAQMMMEIIPIMFWPFFKQIDLVIGAINLFREDKLRTLTQMTADVADAAGKQMEVEKANLAQMAAAHKNAQGVIMTQEAETTAAMKSEWEKRLETIGKSVESVKTIFTDLETAITQISDMLVNSMVDSIESWKTTSREVFASMAKGFTELVSGALKQIAKQQLILAATSFANPGAMATHFANAAAATAAAGVVKALGGTIVGKIMSAAGGADFITAGPQMLMVGDNPSGRERVQVTPSERGDIDSGLTISINNLTVQADNPRSMIDQIMAIAEQSGSRLFRRGAFA